MAYVKQIDIVIVFQIYQRLHMKHRLTHEVLHYLKAEGYTILVGIEMLAGIDKARISESVFTPVEWDVEEFRQNSQIEEYYRHSFLLIEDLLNADLRHLFGHKVVIPEV